MDIAGKSLKLLVFIAPLMLQSGCLEQYNPRPQWRQFEKERLRADQPVPKLAEGGTLPNQGGEGGEAAAADPQQLYQQFCATCHGPEGMGNGVAAAAMPADQKPRNFTDASWQASVTDEHIAKVIREGGASVGLSPAMPPWGSQFSDEEIKGLVQVVRSFKSGS